MGGPSDLQLRARGSQWGLSPLPATLEARASPPHLTFISEPQRPRDKVFFPLPHRHARKVPLWTMDTAMLGGWGGCVTTWEEADQLSCADYKPTPGCWEQGARWGQDGTSVPVWAGLHPLCLPSTPQLKGERGTCPLLGIRGALPPSGLAVGSDYRQGPQRAQRKHPLPWGAPWSLGFLKASDVMAGSVVAYAGKRPHSSISPQGLASDIRASCTPHSVR